MKSLFFGMLFWLPVTVSTGNPANTSRFEDVSEKIGLGSLSGEYYSKAAWCDFDNDGWVDLLTNGTLWRNIGGEKFIKFFSLGSGIWGDYDNDGYPDIYCYGSNKLFRNMNGKEFKDVSSILPPGSNTVSFGAAWGDFNGDGFLDLYIAGYENWEAGITYPDFIFMNQEGREFKLAWSETRYRARGVTACDFDQDGDIDIYVSNYRLQPNLLWLNDGKGNFQDVGASYGVAGDGDLGAWGHTIGSAWGDFDNDGYFDLFVGNFSHPPAYQDRPKFLRNGGPEKEFHFEDLSVTAGLQWQESYASPALGDFDNDGFLDLFFTTVYQGDHSVLYRNNGNWKFTDVTSALNIKSALTYQAAWADYDNDGNLDMVTGGRLFRNHGFRNNWVKIRLCGSGKVNRSAIGTQVHIRSGRDVFARQVEGGTGEGNQNDLMLHFGLGKRKGPMDMEITWSDGTKQRMILWRLNRLIDVRLKKCSSSKKEVK